MREADKIRMAYEKQIKAIPYQFVHYKKFDYDQLRYIFYEFTRGSGRRVSYNDIIIMGDTETSKKRPDEKIIEKGKVTYKTRENHVVAWTISLRAFHHNIVTLYGRKPSKMIETMIRIHEHMQGMNTVFYFHNLSYDHWMLRRFMYNLMGVPVHQLNVKSHYPIYIEFENGIILKDSMILAQRGLDRWAKDLDVSSQKAVGFWDYDKIRDQSTPLSPEELIYIEHDTLAGVECIDKTLEALNKRISSVPLTATGIPREKTRRAGGRQAHDKFLKMALTLDQYKKWCQIFHGGYTHGNRHYYNTLINWDIVQCFDFASSYPYIMLSSKFAMEKFTSYKNCSIKFIQDHMEDYAFAFKFTAVNIRLKTDMEPMPSLQFSKTVKCINPILDNGRILAANYVEIYLTEWDLAVIAYQYQWEHHICTEVEGARKDYLPRWFTDFIYKCFYDKSYTKYILKDSVLTSISKSIVNSLYGMCVQRNLQNDIVEDYESGEYIEKPIENEVEAYDKYLNKMTSILPYHWGCLVTSIGFYNVHQLAKCCRLPLYMDTDSCYGIGWDMEKVNAYNQGCKDKLLANGYGAVMLDGREIWLGVAESDGDKDKYTEFKYMGAKRYCGRCVADGKLHLTVAGVPKKNGALCLSEDLDQFAPGFIFSGEQTGKKTHVYFTHDIYIDDHGNETGDSISLIPCDYKLDAANEIDWENLFNEEVQIQIYDED